MTIVANLLVTTMSVTYFLLAVQAEPITKTFGFIFGTLLALALIVQVSKQGKKDA